MRRDRGLGCQLCNGCFVCDDQSGAALAILSVVAPVPHAPVQTNSVAFWWLTGIQPLLVNFRPGLPCQLRIAVANLGMQGNGPVCHILALAFDFAADRIMRIEGRMFDPVLRCAGASACKDGCARTGR